MRLACCSVAIVLALNACGSDGGADPCGPVLREPLDPSSAVHLLPGSEEPDYGSDPPTSGPHQPSPAVESIMTDPLPRPVQVGILESGGILLQYRRADVERSAVEALAGEGIVVAPSDDIDDPLVLTAWTAKQRCDVLDVSSVEAFVEEWRGEAPGSDE